MQVTEFAIGALLRHTFTPDDVPRERLRHFVEHTVNVVLVTVKVSKLTLIAEESLLQRDVSVHV